jgi:hypothetical protein
MLKNFPVRERATTEVVHRLKVPAPLIKEELSRHIGTSTSLPFNLSNKEASTGLRYRPFKTSILGCRELKNFPVILRTPAVNTLGLKVPAQQNEHTRMQ